MAAFVEEDFIAWLQSQGVTSTTTGILEGHYACMHSYSYIHVTSFFPKNLDNEVDRKGFQLLTDDDIAEIIKPIGARRKLISLRDSLNEVSA